MKKLAVWEWRDDPEANWWQRQLGLGSYVKVGTIDIKEKPMADFIDYESGTNIDENTSGLTGPHFDYLDSHPAEDPSLDIEFQHEVTHRLQENISEYLTFGSVADLIKLIAQGI